MKRVNAIISTYYPDLDNINNIRIISKQSDRVFICDNSPSINTSIYDDIQNCKVYADGINYGLAKGFNNILKDSENDWQDQDLIIFFDQDSNIAEGYIDSLIEEFLNLRTINSKVACVGPVFHNSSNGKTEVPHLKTQINEYSYIVKNIITSSMLTDYKDMKDIDFWNEDLFLDYVDWDFCWRLEKNNKICCITEKVVLNHSVGTGEKRIGPVSLRVGATIREYYQTRDSLNLMKKDYVPIKMKARLFANVSIRPVVHLLLFENKDEILKYIKRGFKDHRANVTGEYKE